MAEQIETKRALEQKRGMSPVMIATVAALALGAGIAAALLVSRLFFAGSEPPIRVKNGSLMIEVLHNTNNWKGYSNESGDPSLGEHKWKVKSGTRGRQDLEMYIVPKASSSCGGGLNPTGRFFRLYYGTNDTHERWIDINGHGNKTRVSSDLDLNDDNERVLADAQEGYYVRRITVRATPEGDQTVICTFDNKDALIGLIILDT